MAGRLGFHLLVAGSVGANFWMVSGAQSSPVRCQVVEGDKLKGAAVDAAMLCAAVDRSVTLRAPAAEYEVRVRILSPSRLVATLTVNGRVLPEQNFSVMDRNLSETTIGHFADALADAVAKAAKL